MLGAEGAAVDFRLRFEKLILVRGGDGIVAGKGRQLLVKVRGNLQVFHLHLGFEGGLVGRHPFGDRGLLLRRLGKGLQLAAFLLNPFGNVQFLDLAGVARSLRNLEVQVREGVGKVAYPLGVGGCGVFLGKRLQLVQGKVGVLPLFGDVVELDLELLLP